MTARTFVTGLSLLLAAGTALAAGPQGQPAASKTRLAVIGLNHDHVWGLLDDIAREPDAQLVAIAEPNPSLVSKARSRVPANVEFFADYQRMLDAVKPDAAVVATENDRHRAILEACAARHIPMMTEKPMATTAADALAMEQAAQAAHIQLAVNYWNAWVAPVRELVRRVQDGDLGPVNKIVVRYGHQGPREIGVSPEFAAWLYDPVRNGGGALMDFGCYGAELALWMKGRPESVYARSLTLKTAQHNRVEDDALIVLQYPDADGIVQSSWDWPYNEDSVEVFGPKGSMIATRDRLLERPANSPAPAGDLEGTPVKLEPLEARFRSPIAYFVDCIRRGQPIGPPLSTALNVQVNEILDAAKQSIACQCAVKLREETQ